MPGVAPDTMAHLFDCLKHPTHLTVCDRWDQPEEAADFIYFINDEMRLPDHMTGEDMMGYKNNTVVSASLPSYVWNSLPSFWHSRLFFITYILSSS